MQTHENTVINKLIKTRKQILNQIAHCEKKLSDLEVELQSLYKERGDTEEVLNNFNVEYYKPESDSNSKQTHETATI